MIGRRIKELRNNAKMTQEQLSEGIISRTYLSLIEKGTVSPSNNVLVQLSKRLGVSVNEFMIETNDYQYSHLDINREIVFYENKLLDEDLSCVKEFIEKDFLSTEDISKIDLSRVYLIYGSYYFKKNQLKKSIQYLNEAGNILEHMPINEYYIRYILLKSDYFINGNHHDQALDLLESTILGVSNNINYKFEMIQLIYQAVIIYFKEKEYFTVLRLIKSMDRLIKPLNITYYAEEIRYMKSISLFKRKKFDTLELISQSQKSVFDQVLYTYCLLQKGNVKKARQIYEKIEHNSNFEALNNIIEELDERLSSII